MSLSRELFRYKIVPDSRGKPRETTPKIQFLCIVCPKENRLIVNGHACCRRHGRTLMSPCLFCIAAFFLFIVRRV